MWTDYDVFPWYVWEWATVTNVSIKSVSEYTNDMDKLKNYWKIDCVSEDYSIMTTEELCEVSWNELMEFTKNRCSGCAYLYEDKNNNWICDAWDKPIIGVRHDECELENI